MQLTRSKAIAVHKGGAFTLSFLNIFLIEIWVSDLGEKNNSVKNFAMHVHNIYVFQCNSIKLVVWCLNGP